MRSDLKQLEKAGPGRGDHWRDLARQWRQVGPPPRPVAEDLRFCGKAVGE